MPFAPKGGVTDPFPARAADRCSIALRRRLGTGLPDDAIEGIRHVDVSGLVEGQRIEAGTGDRVHEHTGLTGLRVDLEDVSGFPKSMTSRSLADRIEAEPEHVRGSRSSMVGDLVEQFAVRAEDEEQGRPGGLALGVEAERRNVNVAVGSDREAFDAAGGLRHNGQHVNVAALPRVSRCRGENSDHKPECDPADLQSCHGLTSPWFAIPLDDRWMRGHDSIALGLLGRCVIAFVATTTALLDRQ